MWKSAISVAFLLIFAIAGSAKAQTDTKSESSSSVSKQQGQSVSETSNAANQYQSSLEGLSTFYDQELKRLTEQNAKIKELFNDGLVSRRDLEQSDQAVVEARKKIEVVAKQIAEAKSPPQKSDAIIIGRSAGSFAWSTGN
jgi:hypothetical protein